MGRKKTYVPVVTMCIVVVNGLCQITFSISGICKALHFLSIFSILISLILLSVRFAAMHQWAQCISARDGQPTDWTNSKLQLGGCVQSSYYSTQSHELWKWGLLTFLVVACNAMLHKCTEWWSCSADYAHYC